MGSSIGDRLSQFGAAAAGGGGGAKKAVLAIGIAIGVLFLASSSASYISPGHVGIVIHRAGGGVDNVPLGPGLHLRNPQFSPDSASCRPGSRAPVFASSTRRSRVRCGSSSGADRGQSRWRGMQRTADRAKALDIPSGETF